MMKKTKIVCTIGPSSKNPQTLARLIDQGMDVDDRRRRLLDLTEKGRALERRLTDLQSRRIARAFAEAGPEAVEGFRNLMRGLINEEDRHRIRCHPSDLDN